MIRFRHLVAYLYSAYVLTNHESSKRMEEFLELDANEYPDHPLISSILYPSGAGPNTLSADSLPRSLFEFSKHLWRIRQEETRSATCCEFYDTCILQLAELAREDSEYNPLHISLTIGDCPSKLTPLLLVKRLSQRCEDARLIHACLDSPTPLQSAKLLMGIHTNNLWIRKLFVEVLATRARHWDLCVSRGAMMIEAKDFDYDDLVTEHLQRASEAAQSLWEETSGLMTGDLSDRSRLESTCEYLVRRWGGTGAPRCDLDRELRSWSASRRELNEKALLAHVSTKAVNSLEWLRDSYLLHREQGLNVKDRQFNKVAATLRYLLPSLSEYETLSQSTRLLVDTHAAAMAVHWTILKAQVLEPRPREMAFILWSVLDGVFRAIGAFWTQCVHAIREARTMSEFREIHQDYLDSVSGLFEDGSIKRLCESVDRFCALVSGAVEDPRYRGKTLQSEDILRSTAYKSFHDCAVFVKSRSQFDTDYDAYFFFL